MITLKNEGSSTYKHTDMGLFPLDWEIFNLPDVIWFQEGPGLRKWQFKTRGLKVINVTNLQENGFLDLDRTDRHISWEEFEKTYKHFACDDGDLVIASSGNSYCKVSIVRACDLPLLMNTSVIRFKPLGTFSKSYMDVYLKSKYFKDQIDLMITGGAQPNFGPAHLSLVKIPAPVCEHEQTAIANALSDVDALIQELEKLIVKKQAIKTATMQQLLTGCTRLPQFAHHPDGRKKGYKPSELGEIPEDWNISNVKQVSLVPMQNGLFYQPLRKGKGVPLINVSDMYKTAPIDVQGLELFDATPAEIKVFKVSYGDLFFTRSSVVPSGIAYCNIFHSERNDVVFDSHLIRVRPNTDLVDPNYLYLNCTSKHARNALIAEAKTATMTTIDQGAINRCPVLIPTKSEQSAIANMLSDMVSEIQALDQRLYKTRQIKQGMMQELLTGRTRLVKPAGAAE